MYARGHVYSERDYLCVYAVTGTGRLTLCGPSWGSTGLCIGGVWERGPGGPGEAWGVGGSGPVLLGFILAKGEFCCLFILVLSSTYDTKGCQAGQVLPPWSQNVDPHLL